MNRNLGLPQSVQRTDQDAQLLLDSFEGLVPIHFGILLHLSLDGSVPFLPLLQKVAKDGPDSCQDTNNDRDGVDKFVAIVGADD